jgi:hypothetical protein
MIVVKVFVYLDKVSNYNRFSHGQSQVSLQKASKGRNGLSENLLKTPRENKLIFEFIKRLNENTKAGVFVSFIDQSITVKRTPHF